MSNNKLPHGWGKREKKPAKWVKQSNNIEDSDISEPSLSNTNASANVVVEKPPVDISNIEAPPVDIISSTQRPILEQANSNNAIRQPAYPENDFQKSLQELAYLTREKQFGDENNITCHNNTQSYNANIVVEKPLDSEAYRHDNLSDKLSEIPAVEKTNEQNEPFKRNRATASAKRRKQSRNKNPLIRIMIVIMVVLIVVGGVVLYLFLGNGLYENDIVQEPIQEPLLSEPVEEPPVEQIVEPTPIEEYEPEPIHIADVNLVGNTSGNIVNLGRAAIQGEWIFYFGGDGLYRKRLDGTETQRITDDNWVSNINAVGDWVYFIADNNIRFGIHRLNIFSEEVQKIHDEVVSDMNVAGDWIYFFNANNVYLSRMRTDGSELQELLYGWVSNVIVANDWIYFIGEAGGILERIKIDGSSRETVIEYGVAQFVVVDDWIYYVGSYYTDGLNRFNIYSGEVQNLHSDFMWSINVSGDWIFYIFGRDIYRMRVDGTNNERLSSTIALDINVVGDWIFYSDWSFQTGSLTINRMRTDGSMHEQIFEETHTAMEDFCITGTWVYVTTTFGDDETSQPIYEFTINPPTISVYDDNTLFAIFWESATEAVLVPVSRYEFLITEQVATGEGERWNPDDAFLQYDVESQLLRWTFFNPFSSEYVHHFFARG